MDLAEEVWNIVVKWNSFSHDTIGKQLVRSADSIAANLSEGFGRYFYKENRQFCSYSRGSLYETKTWLRKAHTRNLVSDDDYAKFCKDIDKISIKLNNYIKSFGNKTDGKAT